MKLPKFLTGTTKSMTVVPVSDETKQMLITIADGRPVDEVVAEVVEERYKASSG